MLILFQKTYRYGLLVALLVALFLYFYQPTPTVVEVPVAKPGVVVMPGGTTTVVYDDRLPLNVEVFVKRLVEQQLAKKQDDTLSRVMQSAFPLSRAVCPAILWPLCSVSGVLAL
jgi:hypothetical protein